MRWFFFLSALSAFFENQLLLYDKIGDEENNFRGGFCDDKRNMQDAGCEFEQNIGLEQENHRRESVVFRKGNAERCLCAEDEIPVEEKVRERRADPGDCRTDFHRRDRENLIQHKQQDIVDHERDDGGEEIFERLRREKHTQKP